MVFELLQVFLLFGNLFSELKELLLLALADSVVLVCFLAFAECVSIYQFLLAYDPFCFLLLPVPELSFRASNATEETVHEQKGTYP